jgi:hypothetical protein
MTTLLLTFLLLFSASDKLTIENDYRERITVYRMCGTGEAGRLADVEAYSEKTVTIQRCTDMRLMVRFHPHRNAAISERLSTLPGNFVLTVDGMGHLWDTIILARQSTI